MKLREFYTLKHKPESETYLQKQRENKRKQVLLEYKSSPELERILQTINFSALATIFQDIFRKTDLDVVNINVIGNRDIISMKGKVFEGPASYDSESNTISLRYNHIFAEAKDRMINPNLVILYIICHEESHANTRIISTGYREVNVGGAKFKQKTGYGRSTYKITSTKPFESEREDLWDYFEEGVNEKLGREVLRRYLTANPDFASEKDIHRLEEILANEKGSNFYGIQLALVETLISRISRKTGFSTDQVWHAILRDKLEATGFDDIELKDMINEITSPEFIEYLGKAWDKRDFSRLIDRLNNDDDSH